MSLTNHEPSIDGRPVQVLSPVDTVRRRVEESADRGLRFEMHDERHEIQDCEARLLAAGVVKIRRSATDLAKLLGLGHDTLIKYVNGTRTMPFDVLAAMKWASKRVPEAREWCVAVARELLPEGWTLTPPPAHVDLVVLITNIDEGASRLAGQAMHAMADDGKVNAKEAAEQLVTAEDLRRRVTELEAELRRRAGVQEPAA